MSEDTTLGKIAEEKLKLESAIRAALEQFSRETGLVARVDVENDVMIGSRYEVHVEVRI